MKRLLYRKLSMILILCLAVSFGISEPTFAKKEKKKGTWGKNMTWELKGSAKKHNQTLIVTCNGKMKSLGYHYSPNLMCWDSLSIKKVIVKGKPYNIGEAAFSGLKILEKVVLPNTIRRIGDIAFDYTEKLHFIKLPSDLRVIGNRAFSNSGIKSISIPKKVRKLSREAFELCFKLNKVKMHNKIRKIGGLAFWGCTRLRNIKLCNSIRVIERGAFCLSGLRRITIPKNVEYLGKSAFWCNKLKRVVIKSKKIKYFGKEVFGSLKNKKMTIVVPKEKYEEYKSILLSEKRVSKNTEILASKN